MPGSNVNGFPYPLPSDPIRNGADTIKALADRLPMILAGTVDVMPTAADSNTSVAVVFSRPFPGVPFVVVSPTVSPPGSGYGLICWAGSITKTGFNAAVKRSTVVVTTLNWVAYYPPVTP